MNTAQKTTLALVSGLLAVFASASLSHAWGGGPPVWYPQDHCVVQQKDGKMNISAGSSAKTCQGIFYPGHAYQKMKNRQPF